MKRVDFYIQERIVKAWNSGARFVVLHGGRGSSKSTAAGAICAMFAVEHPGSRILCVRGTQNKISESSLQVIKEVVEKMQLTGYFTMTENTIKCNNGAEFLFYGAKNYQSFKSLQGINLVWIDEATELSKEAWEALIPTIREEDSRFLIVFNAEKEKDWVYDNFVVHKYPNSIVEKINWYDNDYFPDVLREQMEWDRATNTSKYNHIWEGELAIDIQGALFKSEWFKVGEPEEEEYDHITVAIDPSGSSNKTSDACGIVVTGKIGNTYYVLDDCTGVMSPQTWANTAITLYNKWEADHIVYESNFGGDIVKTVLQQVDRSIPVKPVRASRGKLIRAEPVAVLYEKGQVFHTRKFKDLEYEMITYSGAPGQRSPNRLDALVYSIMDMQEQKLHVATGMNLRF